ncbi:NACHT domain-containing protein [Streptomyces sp. NBC_01257]|uniref:NACHT domain-containing protein n=1 Tax=Streptomyces sp. NBC_01257 TaxID=2903799 RepID=UPI002DD98E8D|nr:hypothetical protein [Streptomyces sp. NBC_01257]WRZ68811.1 hypothetical protein OG408_35200 [Streptomyces sp. NBC_01257]
MIADLVAAPDRQLEPLKTLAHVEFQLRVLGLLCAAAAGGPTELTTPGSLDRWSTYVKRQQGSLECDSCRASALVVADSINMEIAPGMSLRRMRNQVFHGGPDPQNVDLDTLHQVVEDNATRIVRIHEHGHATNLEPFFTLVRGEPAALQDYSSATATYWPRSGPATDISDQGTLDALQKLGLQGGDRMFESFAADIEKDLRGFAKPGSVQTLVDPPEPIAARWELRTSEGSVRRVDHFELDVDHARIWRSEAGPRPYKAFLAEICKWDLLKERLLEGLDEQVELEKKISDELFPDLKRHIPNVPAQVHIASGPFGEGRDVTITEACARISQQAGIYNACTNLITLTGEAGSGKTHSLLQFARESLSSGEDLSPLAVYISSSGASANSLDTLLDARMAPTRILDKRSVLALCRAGLVILVIDGFDELLGFRTYDNPLTGLKPILDELRGKGTVVLSARSSYSEARLLRSLTARDALAWPPYMTPLELLPWRPEQLRALTSQLPIEVDGTGTPQEIRQLLTTPFFCLAFVDWVRTEGSGEFMQFVVDTYLQRERRKMPGQGGNDLFSSEVLADIFSEVSELIARNVVPEISGEDFELAASLALGRDLNKEEKRRLVALCGLSAEWADDELAFKFTHLAIAEQFLARQIARLPLDQAVSLLFSVPISPLCAQLILSMWKSQGRGQPTELVMELQHKVSAAYASDAHLPGASLSLGALWAKVHGVGEGPRTGRCISVENLELSGSGQVTLVDARVQNLTVEPGVELLLASGRVERLDLSRSGASALLGDSYKHVRELLMHNELAVGRPSIKRALGLADEQSADDSDNHFKANITRARGPIIVKRDYAPDENSQLHWVSDYGLDTWQAFVRRMQKEGKISIEKVNASGRPKVRLRPTESFDA